MNHRPAAAFDLRQRLLVGLPQQAGDRVRQGADSRGYIRGAWRFNPSGAVVEGPQGMVTHLICGGVYDQSTGLIYKGGRYLDPHLGLWLALTPLVVVQSWRGPRKRRRWALGVSLVLLAVGVSGSLAGCCGQAPQPLPTVCTETPTRTPTPTHTPTPTNTPTPTARPRTQWEIEYGEAIAQAAYGLLNNNANYYIWGASGHPSDEDYHYPPPREQPASGATWGNIDLYARTGGRIPIVCADVIALSYKGAGLDLTQTYPAWAAGSPYGRDCLGEQRGSEPGLSGVEGWLYYLSDASGYVRQGADSRGYIRSTWRFNPSGALMEGPQGMVTHLICGGVYDQSTGLIYKGGRYLDPHLGLWLALTPLVVVQSWRGHRGKRRGWPWAALVALCLVGVSGTLTACRGQVPQPLPTVCTEVTTSMPTATWTPTPTHTPTPTYTPTPTSTPTPTLLPIEWFEGDWKITHYIYVLESDPAFANDERITVPGLSQDETYRRNFIYGRDPTGPRGVVFQGTGRAENGKYITIDWWNTPQDALANDRTEEYLFTYGEGGAYAGSVPWETVATLDPRLRPGDKIVIEIYPGRIFTVTDAGGGLAPSSHIDVFVGEMTLAEGDALGTRYSRVGKVVKP